VWPEGGAQGTPFRFIGIGTELDNALRLGFVSKLLPSLTVTPKPAEARRVDWVAAPA